MPLTNVDTAAVAKAVATADVYPAPASLKVTDGTITLQDFLTRIFNRVEATGASITALATAEATRSGTLLDAVKAGRIDPQALATQLAGPLAVTLSALLPTGVDVSPDIMFEAMQRAFTPQVG